MFFRLYQIVLLYNLFLPFTLSSFALFLILPKLN